MKQFFLFINQIQIIIMIPQSIDATIFASAHPSIAKRTSVSGLILSSLLVILGLVALISSNRLEEDATPLTIVLMLSGTILIILGVLRLVWKGKEVVYLPTGSVTRERSFFFDLKHLDALKDSVTTGRFSLASDMHSEVNGNIRMDVIVSEDKQFAAVQLFQFVPYAYNPVTSVCYYTNGEAGALSSFLIKSGCKV